jgi:hypothetical protein
LIRNLVAFVWGFGLWVGAAFVVNTPVGSFEIVSIKICFSPSSTRSVRFYLLKLFAP